MKSPNWKKYTATKASNTIVCLDDHAPLAEIFGVASGRLRDALPFQNLGSVTTPEGRLLA